MIDGRLVNHQGALDGLCGPYAIANALALCGIKSFETVFRSCLMALPKRRWPSTLWEGTDVDDLAKMLRALSPLMKRHSIKVSQPFAKCEPKGAAEYWRRFDEQFADPASQAAILGLTKPLHHWIVARPQGGRIQFVDSRPEDPKPIKNRASLAVGLRNRDAKWLIDPSELILFRNGALHGQT